MDFSSAGLIGLALRPIGWLYAFYTDQTDIDILGQGDVRGSQVLPVDHLGNCAGILLFGVTTRAKGLVEIVRVQLDFASHLRLSDPDGRGFFDATMSAESELPFRLSWTGCADIRIGLIQAFALAAEFKNANAEYPVQLTVHARRVRRDAGGFERRSRTRVTAARHLVSLVNDPTGGLAVPPGFSLTSPQPFLVEGPVTASGPMGSSFLVHELMKNGETVSRSVGLADTSSDSPPEDAASGRVEGVGAAQHGAAPGGADSGERRG